MQNNLLYRPFEVFISYKRNKIGGGGVTRDYYLAKDLYETLTKLGIKTFFSEQDISTDVFINQINQALKEAKILIAVGTSCENMESQYVQYEWSTFHNEILNGNKANCLMYTYLEGMDPRQTPLSLHRLDSFASSQKEKLVGRIYYNLRKSNLTTTISPAPPIETITLKKSYIAVGAVVVAVVIGLVLLINTISNNILPSVSSEGEGESDISVSSWYDDIGEPTVTTTTTTQVSDETTGIGNVSVGSTVYFGSYPQSSTGSYSSIQWRVLKTESGKALLISEKLLDSVAYHEDNSYVTWKDSSLREWLIGEFYEKAFDNSQKSLIYGSESDKVFLLNTDEVSRFFDNDDDRSAEPTEYAKQRGSHVSSNGKGWWWVSSNKSARLAFFVDSRGTLYENGRYVNDESVSIRPAIWVYM